MSQLRLDYIRNFKPGTVEKMAEIRAKYIALEAEVKELYRHYAYLSLVGGQKDRVFNEAQTHLEQSCMYAIKFLCLAGEVKED